MPILLPEVAPWDGIHERITYDEETQSLVWKRTSNVTPFLDRNADLRNGDQKVWRGEDNDFWLVASIPNIVIESWLREGVDVYNKADWPEVKRRLNSPDWNYLKTAPVRI